MVSSFKDVTVWWKRYILIKINYKQIKQNKEINLNKLITNWNEHCESKEHHFIRIFNTKMQLNIGTG